MNQNTTQKTARKLQLSRETLRELDSVEARNVVGGLLRTGTSSTCLSNQTCLGGNYYSSNCYTTK